MELDLRGKRAVVLAASKGLGRAAAEALAREGVRVVVTSSSAERADWTAAEIAGRSGAEVHGVASDLFDPLNMDALFETSCRRLGGVDILFVNGPGPHLGPAHEMATEVLERQLRMALVSPVRLIGHLLPAMRERRWGRILANGGASIVQPAFNKAMDNVVRPALVGFLKTLANEVAADGVTANVVIPGIFVTNRVDTSTRADADLLGVTFDQVMARRLDNIPARRFGDLREFGDLVAFLCSERAAFMTGSIVRLDGGQIKSIV